ncbi:MAG TPA: CBS domain-containing protein [Candidatus Binatia bacterium]|jgi:signal-transduction protein with cAMP-binding, CBS, and nucleotidyltransferase domain|nr:CBS domain-containing protein [Candidatus Binatia bacterium]
MLSNKVSEIMTTNLTKAPVSSTIFEVMEMMVAEDVGRVIITDDDIPVGIFTEKDVLKRVVNAKIEPRKAAIKNVMTTPARAVREETHIVDAFGKMYRGKYRHLLVRGRRGKIVGIVSMRRILNLAVELGQGLNETKTLGDIAAPAIVSVDQSAMIHETIELMNTKSVSAVVVTAAGKPSGIFTERDVLKRVATKEINVKQTPISQVMTAPVITMPQSALVGDVLVEMSRRDIRNMPVSGDGGELTGIVSMPEILQYAQAFNVDEQVRRTWKEVAEYLDTEDQYTPG